MPRDSNTDRIASVEDDIVTIRERITRVETSLEANEAAAQARHHELLAAFQDMRTRQDASDQRAWKLALALLALGLGGGAKAIEWLRPLVQ